MKPFNKKEQERLDRQAGKQPKKKNKSKLKNDSDFYETSPSFLIREGKPFVDTIDKGTSTQFCIKQLPKQKPDKKIDMSKAEEISPIQLWEHSNYPHKFPGKIYYKLSDGLNVVIEIDYKPNSDFEYFTSHSVIHDGTTMFYWQAIFDCFNCVLNGGTYLKTKGYPSDRTKDWVIHYTIGNLVVVNEFGNFDVDKPWMQQRTFVMLPIKYDWEYKERDEE